MLMGFWLRLWDSIGGLADDSRLRELLMRVADQQSTWILYDAGRDSLNKRRYHSDGSEYCDPLFGNSVLDEGREGSEQHVIDDTAIWTMRMTFARSTSDGALTTTVYSASDHCSVMVDLQGTGLLEGYYFFADAHSDPRMVKILSAKVNPFAVRYVRNWVRNRVLGTFEAAKAERTEQREAERRSRGAQLSAMRKKHLP